jgi:hypothetical protein
MLITEKTSFTKEKEFPLKVPIVWRGENSAQSASPRRGFRGLYGMKKQDGLRQLEARRSEVIGGLCVHMCKQTSRFFIGCIFRKWQQLACSMCGVLGSLTSKDHQWGTCTG